MTVPPERVELLRDALERELRVELYLKSREVLERIMPLLPKLREELNRVHELDFLLAVKGFTGGFSFPPDLWRVESPSSTAGTSSSRTPPSPSVTSLEEGPPDFRLRDRSR